MRQDVRYRKQQFIRKVFGGDILELIDGILKDFADAVNTGSEMTPSDSQHIYATVTRIVEGDLVYVTINGSELETPAKTLVEVGVNDLVMCTMRAHTLTIIGNVSYPALTRVGPVYMTLTAEGLLIGKLSDDNQPIDGYIIVGTNGSSIYDINGNMLATFGSTAQVGKTTASHVVTTNNGVEIRNGSNKILADFTANGITLRDSTGTTIASFAPNAISIGQSTSATVSFCGGKANIALDGSTLKIIGGNNVDAIGMTNAYGNYKSEVVCEAKNSSPKAALQLLNGSNTIAALVLSNNGANVTIPSNKALTVNNKEVVKVDGVVATGALNLNTKIVDRGWVGTLDQKVSVPDGYKLIGLCGISSAEYSGTQHIGSWHVTPSDNKIHLKIDTTNANAARISLSYGLQWFAIRTSGITSGGSSRIDW